MFLTHDAILKQHLFYLMIMSPVVAKIGVNFIEGEKIVLQSLYKMSHRHSKFWSYSSKFHLISFYLLSSNSSM